jgi:feruloyl esterase
MVVTSSVPSMSDRHIHLGVISSVPNHPRLSRIIQPQVEAAAKIYAGPTNPRTGEQIFPGLKPGSELGWFILGSFPEPPMVASYFKYLVFHDPAWDFRKLNFDATLLWPTSSIMV